MTALTTLDKIKFVCRGEDEIQQLDKNDPVVVDVLEAVDNLVTESKFGSNTELAQRYLAAHFLAASLLVGSGGRGPVSSESIGDVSVSYTLPYLNQISVLASTQYGLMYLELSRRVVVPMMVVSPGQVP